MIFRCEAPDLLEAPRDSEKFFFFESSSKVTKRWLSVSPQSNPKSNPKSNFLTRKGHFGGLKSCFSGYFRGDPESHFLVTFELLLIFQSFRASRRPGASHRKSSDVGGGGRIRMFRTDLRFRLPCTDPKSGLRPEMGKKRLKNGFWPPGRRGKNGHFWPIFGTIFPFFRPFFPFSRWPFRAGGPIWGLYRAIGIARIDLTCSINSLLLSVSFFTYCDFPAMSTQRTAPAC